MFRISNPINYRAPHLWRVMRNSKGVKSYYISGHADHRTRYQFVLDASLESGSSILTYVYKRYLNGCKVYLNQSYSCVEDCEGFLIELIIEDTDGKNHGRNVTIDYIFKSEKKNWKECDQVASAIMELLAKESIIVEDENDDDYEQNLESILDKGLDSLIVVYA